MLEERLGRTAVRQVKGNKKVVKFIELFARATLEVLSLTRAAISMSSLVM